MKKLICDNHSLRFLNITVRQYYGLNHGHSKDAKVLSVRTLE